MADGNRHLWLSSSHWSPFPCLTPRPPGMRVAGTYVAPVDFEPERQWMPGLLLCGQHGTIDRERSDAALPPSCRRMWSVYRRLMEYDDAVTFADLPSRRRDVFAPAADCSTRSVVKVMG